MGKNQTPDWLDEEWEREHISPERYYHEFGLTRKQYWALYWQQREER